MAIQKTAYRLPVIFFGLLAAYLLIFKRETLTLGYMVTLGAFFVGCVALAYFGIKSARSKMLKNLGNSKSYKSHLGITVWLPEQIQYGKYVRRICDDIDTVYIATGKLLEEEWSKAQYKPGRIVVIIMPMLNAFPHAASPTKFAAGDCTCMKNGAQVRIALRPERKGSSLILQSKPGYLKPLGWEMKNVFNCKNKVGGWDYAPGEYYLTQTAKTMNSLRFPFTQVLEEKE